MQLVRALVLVITTYSTGVISFSESHMGQADTSFADAVVPRTSSTFKLRTPHFSLSPRQWFDVEKERNHWKEVSARLNVFMNSKLDSEEVHGVDYGSVLKKDVALSDKLDKEIQRMNAAIQSEWIVPSASVEEERSGRFSFLETGDGYSESDWTFCTCQSGSNGTLVYPERNWPGVKLPDPPSVDLTKGSLLELRTASMLRLTVRGKRTAVRRSAVCDCANPWESYHDPSGSSICSLNQKTTVCVVRRNVLLGVKPSEQLKQEAVDLLEAIDAMFSMTDSVVPFDSVSTSNASTLESVASQAAESVTTTAAPVEEETVSFLPPAGNYTEDYQPVGENTTSISSTSAPVGSPDVEKIVEAAATIVPYQGDDGMPPTEAPVATTSEPGSWEVLKNVTWESMNGERVTDTIVAKVVNVSEGQNSSSFAEVWTPFQFSF